MRFLYLVLVLLVTTRIFAVIAKRLKLPPIVGELVSGIALGYFLYHFQDVFPLLWEVTQGEAFEALADLGMFFLMLLAGVRMSPLDFKKTSSSAPAVAFGGMLVPIISGTLIGLMFFPESPFKMVQSWFLGTALAITAVPVTIRMLMEFNKLDTAEGKTIVAAALWDDLLSLFILALLLATINNGGTLSFTPALWLPLLGKVLLFFAITIPVGHYLFPLIGSHLKATEIPDIDFSMLLIAALAYAVLAEMLDLHFIIGAFVAGMFFHPAVVEQKVYDRVDKQTSGITSGFLAPIFFVSIGFHLDLTALASIPGFVTLLIIVALLSKLVGAGVCARATGHDTQESLRIGVAMSGRGAVEIVLAGVALRAGLFNHPDPTPSIITGLFSAIVIMAIVTSIVTPLILAFLIRYQERSEA
ncbi:cation:proton antiporter [Shewanella atlantica]|uniref:Cation:proton antiporter n=1 Tax=Shewanella atlantica TaxID=271099 RepID=A0A431W8H3_9GAMM|nr:cation:proton antiporter [Shewanella atlantica]RTR31608.1 cation:proton antiporter [Shewanella atlantica]